MVQGVAIGYPRARFWCSILMLAASAFALEFTYVVEASYGIPFMLKAGLSEKHASAMWAVGPIIGLLFQGYLGAASDRCRSSWGRRRPFILGIAVGVCISVALFPYGRFLSNHLFHLKGGTDHIFVMIFTAGSFVLMDFCLDAFQSPTRAYLLDSVPDEISEKANYLFSAMLGLGATFGSLVSAIPYEKLGFVETGDLESQVKITFGLSLAVVAVCVVLTLNSVKEKSTLRPSIQFTRQFSMPTFEEEFEEDDNVHLEPTAAFPLETSLQGDKRDSYRHEHPTRGNGLRIPGDQAERSTPSSIAMPGVGAINSLGGRMPRTNCYCIRDTFADLYSTFLFMRYMSRKFFLLWLLVVFSWVAFLSQYLFFTNFVGEVVYKGSPTSEDEKVRALYTDGVRTGCWFMMAANIIAFVFSITSELISGYVGVKYLLIAGHVLFWSMTLVTMIHPSIFTALSLALSSGFFYANLMSIPYAMVSHYCEAGILLRRPWPDKDSGVKGKAVAFLVMAMFVAQFLLATTLGLLIDACGSSYVVIVVAFVGECLTGVSLFFVTFKTSRTH